MREHGFRVQQPGLRVDVEVAARLWKQLAHPAHFVDVLGDVRLHVEAGVSAAQFAGHGQLRGRAGGRETHGHRIGIAALAMPARDEVDAIALGLRHVVTQAIGRVAVHQALAADDAHATRLRSVKERVNRGLVHGGEDHGGRRAVGQQGIEKARRSSVCNRRVGPGALGGKGVARQPVE